MRKIRVMGLDLSLKGAGLCVLEEDGTILQQSTAGYPLPKKSPAKAYTERLIDIVKVIVKAGKDHGVTHFWVEDYSYGSKFGGEKLAELHGAAKTQVYLIFKTAIKPVPIKSARVKVLGRGNIPKKEILPLLEKRLGILFSDHNAADAYVVAETARLSLGLGKSLISKQGELFDV